MFDKSDGKVVLQEPSTDKKEEEAYDLVQYLAKQVSANAGKGNKMLLKASNTSAPEVSAKTCVDPPMNDPPYYSYRKSRTTLLEPRGPRYRQPKGRRKRGAPSLSSRLENPNRLPSKSGDATKESRYPSPYDRQRQRQRERPGRGDLIRQVREDAPDQDSYTSRVKLDDLHHPQQSNLDDYADYGYKSPQPIDDDSSHSPEIM